MQTFYPGASDGETGSESPSGAPLHVRSIPHPHPTAEWSGRDYDPRWIDVGFVCSWVFGFWFSCVVMLVFVAFLHGDGRLFALVVLVAALASFFSAGLTRHHHYGVWDAAFLRGLHCLLVGVGSLVLSAATLFALVVVVRGPATSIALFWLGLCLCTSGVSVMRHGWKTQQEMPMCPSCSTLTHMAQRGQVRGWWQCDQPGCLHFSAASCAVCHRQASRTYLDTPICANSACTRNVWEQHRNVERYRSTRV